MSTRWTLGVAVTAAALGAAAGYVAARREFTRQPKASPSGRAADLTTDPASEHIIRVSPRQVQAARVAIEARKLLDEPVPPGLQRIANARRKSTSAEPGPSVAAAERQVIRVTPHQIKAAQIAVKGHKRLGKPIPPGLQRIANVGVSDPDRERELSARAERQAPQGQPRRQSPRSTSERAAAHATEEAWRRLEHRYGLYSGAELGQRLGYRSHRVRVEAQYAAGRLLGVRRGSSLRYPGFQVSPDGELAPVIAKLISVARGHGWTDESLALWLANPSGSVPEDRAPAELLHEDPELVLEAARRAIQPAW